MKFWRKKHIILFLCSIAICAQQVIYSPPRTSFRAIKGLTVIITTFNEQRSDNVLIILKMLQTVQNGINEIFIIWNNPIKTVPRTISTYVSNFAIPIRIFQQKSNSLNNRWAVAADKALSSHILNIDDDIIAENTTINLMYLIASFSSSSLVGLEGRYFGSGPDWEYLKSERMHHMVLPRIMVTSREVCKQYMLPKYAPLRLYVDKQEAHCDDILLNLVSQAENNMGSFKLTNAQYTDLPHARDGLYSQANRFKLRKECTKHMINEVSKINGKNTIPILGTRQPMKPTMENIASIIDDMEKSLPKNIKRFGHILSGGSTTQADFYSSIAALPWIRTICEIGFAAGHSSLIYLESNPDSVLYSFDDNARPEIVSAAEQYIYGRYGHERFFLVKGDSTNTVSSYFSEKKTVECDLISIDGAHHANYPLHDIRSMHAFAAKRNLVLFDDCNDDWPDVLRAIDESVDAGILAITSRHTSGITFRGKQKAWCLGQFHNQLN